MVEATIDSLHVSLTGQTRIVLLKEIDSERYLPILIGPDAVEAIRYELQKVVVPRPMTHDLLKNVISTMKGRVSHIIVTELKNDTFYAKIVLDVNGSSMEIDSRPSDALALAVRVNAKIFIEDKVMDENAIHPEVGLDLETGVELDEDGEIGQDENLEAFEDFIDTLDLDDLGNK
jgi:hypothetical protein